MSDPVADSLASAIADAVAVIQMDARTTRANPWSRWRYRRRWQRAEYLAFCRHDDEWHVLRRAIRQVGGIW